MIWDSLFPDVLPHVAGCPNMMVTHELRRAAQDFFMRTFSWRVRVAPAAISAAQSEVTLSPGTGLELVRIDQVWWDGRELDRETVESLEYRDGNWYQRTGTVDAYTMLEFGKLRLYRIPAVGGSLTYMCSVKPDEASTGLPDGLASSHREAIVSKALANLMLYPNRPWSSPSLAAVNEARYSMLCDKALSNSARGHVGARVHSRIRWF